jgi:arylsulfatase A-like enzyme
LKNDNDKAREGRDFVVVGRERHAAAQPMPSLDGYPSRAIRTDRYLFIMNLEPNRWPVGAPKGGTHAIDTFPDCDPGPTKQFILDHRDDPAIRPLFELDFAKRPAEELYDVQADPDELKNLAADPAHADTVKQMRDKLTTYLRGTGDPRFTGAPVEFDNYPYRDDRTLQRIQKWKAGHPS